MGAGLTRRSLQVWSGPSGSRAQVISLSLGGLRLAADVLDTYTRTIINANRLGIPVVVAVGNEGSQTSGSPGNDYFAFTVGATDSEDWAAGFSGGPHAGLYEFALYQAGVPAAGLLEAGRLRAGDRYLFLRSEGKVGGLERHFHGDPLRSRAMALLLGIPTQIASQPASQRTNLIQSLLISTVKQLGEAGQNHRFGYGRIDVLRALAYARELGYF